MIKWDWWFVNLHTHLITLWHAFDIMPNKTDKSPDCVCTFWHSSIHLLQSVKTDHPTPMYMHFQTMNNLMPCFTMEIYSVTLWLQSAVLHWIIITLPEPRDLHDPAGVRHRLILICPLCLSNDYSKHWGSRQLLSAHHCSCHLLKGVALASQLGRSVQCNPIMQTVHCTLLSNY